MALYFISFLVLFTLCASLLSSTVTYKPSVLEQSWKNRNLSSIPVELDHSLQVLDLSNNAIEHLNILNLKTLEKLDLSYNRLNVIEKDAFKELVHMDYLNLAMNLLDSNVINNSKAFLNLYGLKQLDISLNNLDSEAVGLYIQNATALEQIALNGNSLTRLTPDLFANNRNLVSIDIENNNIFEIEEGTFEHLEKLSVLNLARNNLVHVCDFQLYQLTSLNLSQNSIQFFLSQQNENMYLLKNLDLGYNNLLYFPVLPKKNRLKYLHLQYNKIGALGLEVSISEAKLLHQNLTQDTEEIRNNTSDSKDLLKSLLKLRYIDLKANDFRDFSLTSLSDLMQNLEMLNLSDNCLQKISLGMLGKDDDNQTQAKPISLPFLRHINLQDNEIEYLPKVVFDSLPKLEMLILKGNGVKLCLAKTNISTDTCVSFRGIRSLKHLDLRENGLETIVPYAFIKTQLMSLDLAGNTNLFLGKRSLEGLQRSLKSLSISNSNASSSRVFIPCMTKLRSLNISHNRFHNLSQSFRCLPLTVLDLRSNNFTSLDSVLTNVAVTLDLIYISNNAYSCCNTRWLSVLNKSQIRIPDLDQASCQYESAGNITFHSLLNHNIQCRSVFWISPSIIWAVMLCVMIFLAVVAFVKIMYAKGSLIV
ncbi:transforming growth factor beta activator LRRC33 [Astyanax mexicanus]|uniref:transforming growth factor beta activator LRRC33 n=1 Tax=Astyanax mexicanus TaxID=7994 RepID=UPI0020CAF858|nr:transforming growth factor beta activator LRRC33 [Astyanax mexicanus]